MTMISAQIPDKLFQSLRQISQHERRSSSFLIREALTHYLQELQEDIEDTKDAIRVLTENQSSTPMEEVFKELGID